MKIYIQQAVTIAQWYVKIIYIFWIIYCALIYECINLSVDRAKRRRPRRSPGLRDEVVALRRAFVILTLEVLQSDRRRLATRIALKVTNISLEKTNGYWWSRTRDALLMR